MKTFNIVIVLAVILPLFLENMDTLCYVMLCKYYSLYVLQTGDWQQFACRAAGFRHNLFTCLQAYGLFVDKC